MIWEEPVPRVRSCAKLLIPVLVPSPPPVMLIVPAVMFWLPTLASIRAELPSFLLIVAFWVPPLAPPARLMLGAPVIVWDPKAEYICATLLLPTVPPVRLIEPPLLKLIDCETPLLWISA